MYKIIRVVYLPVTHQYIKRWSLLCYVCISFFLFFLSFFICLMKMVSMISMTRLRGGGWIRGVHGQEHGIGLSTSNDTGQTPWVLLPWEVEPANINTKGLSTCSHPASLKLCLTVVMRYTGRIIWFVGCYGRHRVSLVVADALAPIWRQCIYNHQAATGSSYPYLFPS